MKALVDMTVAELGFHEAMCSLYVRAKQEAQYDAKVFLGKVVELGGLPYAHQLLSTGTGCQYGFDKLWEKGRLDLTVEALVLQPQWATLFSPAELQVAQDRLAAHA